MMHVVIFSQKNTTPGSAHRLAERIGRCAMMHVVIFPRRIQSPISHIDWNRIGRCAMMPVVIFRANPTNLGVSLTIGTQLDVNVMKSM
jgi:hypothetical protein